MVLSPAIRCSAGWAIFDAADWELERQIENCDQVRDVVVTEQSIVVSKAGKPVIALWNIESGLIDIELPVERSCGAMSLSPDGKLLAGSSKSHEIELYDFEKWSLLGFRLPASPRRTEVR